MAGFRGLLYTLAKLMGDYNAVKKGKVGQRVRRRADGYCLAPHSTGGFHNKLQLAPLLVLG